MMELSKHNIFSKIKDSDNYFILNLLSGNADIVEPSKAMEFINKNFTNAEEMVEKGYLSDPDTERSLFRQKYLEFIDNRDSDEIQIFFAPTYSCNFTCSYCYQDEYSVKKDKLNKEIIDAFFNYIVREFSDRKKYVTLFGGEPLLTNQKYKEQVDYFIEKTIAFKIELAIVTNGYTLLDYLPQLSKASIREIQVTLDGTQSIHDHRRLLKNGKGTFDKIVEGINELLENKIPVNLRMVVDKDNIENLPETAKFAIQQGWTKNPLFKTQIGRNYELHHCQLNNQKLFSRVNLYEKIYDMLKQHPEIIEFHKPSFSVSKFLAENGELPEPLFDSCPGTKTEWAFDYTGNIYACTATVGKEDETLGTFYPEQKTSEDIIEEWQDRDVLNIEQCRNCSLQLACGGGCAAVAKNKNGSINSADCRPVKELLEMGIAYYFEQT